jgi:hypothetical protein
MKLTPFRAALCVCALALATVHAQQPPPDRYAEFRTKFKELLAINGHDELAKLVKQYQDQAVERVYKMGNEMGGKMTEELDREFQAMSRAWKTAWNTNYSEKMYVYHSELALEGARKSERKQAVDKFDVTLTKHRKNCIAPTKDAAIFQTCYAEFVQWSAKFEEVGDNFYAAWSEGAAAECVGETMRGGQADLRTECAHLKRAIEFFDKIELTTYSWYMQLKARYEQLVRQGFDKPAEPEAGDGASPEGAAPDPNAPVTAPIVATTSFELITSPEQFVRPSYFNDELYQIWPFLYLQEKGTTTKFDSVDKSPVVVRTDSAKIGIDVDGDTKPDKSFGFTGNLTPVELEIGSGEQKRKWAFTFKTGGDKDSYQGLENNLLPDDRQARLFFVNSGSVLATIGTTPVRVIDDNNDGVYGSAPLTYAYDGLSPNTYQPLMDCMVVGESKRARPWSQYQEIGGTWYELESNKAGVELKATPTPLPIGTIRLEFKGPVAMPTWLVIKGEGKLENCYYDLVDDAKKPVSVPAGTYKLFCGEIRSGKKQQTMKCLIMPGTRTPPWTVKAGAETVVTLGAPFSFEFESAKGKVEGKDDEEGITVKGKTVNIVGVAGERYERPWNCAARPEVSVRKQGTKKGSKPEKMTMASTLQDLKEDGTPLYTQADAWRPVDTTIPIKKGEAVEVQLVEKKNKLFGELESAWK